MGTVTRQGVTYDDGSAEVSSAVARQSTAQQHLDHLAQLLGNAERGMVDLLDARATLEQRIIPALRPEPAADQLLAQAMPDGPEVATQLDHRLADLARVLESLVHSMACEAEQLRGIARRVEL